MHVIGTAGHVDHGKSTLVHALTGVDPDRWQEEKDRGLTIDLGFAELSLPSGRSASIIDVPGHERFIKNMLAGAGGIDLALLVVAADGGVMPQTREHLAIIDLLGVRHGVVAITRADLVEDREIASVRSSVEKLVAITSLAGSPIVTCSATARSGLDVLVAAIDEILASVPGKRDIGKPRLPIDRAFTMPGFGTVVTGTLVDGPFRVGQAVEIAPDGLSARIRGLQNHGRQVDESLPGTRTAINLSGVGPAQLERGMVVAAPGHLKPVHAVDVGLRTVADLPHPVRHNRGVTLHSGAAESGARLILLDTDSIKASESTWAQLRLASPIAVLPGDHYVIRDANGTLGGGRIVEVNPARHRRNHAPTLTALEVASAGSPAQRLFAHIEKNEPIEAKSLPDPLGSDAIRQLERDSAIVVLNSVGDRVLYTAGGYAAAGARVRALLASFHDAAPLRPGMPRGELGQRLGLSRPQLDALLASIAAEEGLRDDDFVSLKDFTPSLSSDQSNVADKYLRALRSNPYSPPTDRPIDPELLAHLVSTGAVVDAGDGIVFDADAYAEMVEAVLARIDSSGPVTLAQVRDLFGTTRKYAQALLETLDRQHLTRRLGDERDLYRPRS